jgi:hypothetical protein
MNLAMLMVGSDAGAFCFDEAGGMYGINPLVLRAIAGVESNMNPEAVNQNVNGTRDVGLMQINTIWRTVLGDERWNKLEDACYNTKTGAWILATCIEKYGYNWKAIGCYNSQTPGKSEVYAKKVFDQLKRLGSRKASQPLDHDVKSAILDRMDMLVERAQKGEKKPVVMKFVPYVRVSREALRNPPEPPRGKSPATVAASVNGTTRELPSP